jgi:hypothetical protein
MSLPEIYRQGGGKVETPPAWLAAAAEEALEVQRVNTSHPYIKIDTPPEELRVDATDPERAVRVHWMWNPDFQPTPPEAA